MANYKLYGYIDSGIDLSYTPINTHLCIEYNGYLYTVPLQNTLTIRKIDASDGTSELIVTEAGTITKFYFDQTNDKLYYYHNQSTFSYVDLTDDSITDLDDTLDACEDLFVYDGSLFAVDTSQDDLTYYKYTPGSPGTWGAVGTIAEGGNNYYNVQALGCADPIGICWVSPYFYITDLNAHTVYKFNHALDTLVDSFDVGALGGNDSPRGLDWDGSYFYICDTDGNIYKYNSALDTLVDSFDVGALGGNDFPTGICWVSPYFYVCDTDGNVYKYNSALDTLVDSFDVGTLAGNDFPYGIYWDGTYFYICDVNDAVIYKYNSALDTLIDIFNIGALGGNDLPYDICWDGTYFYITDPQDNYVYAYSSDLKTELGSILYSTVISNDVYTIYQYITGDCKIYVKDLDTADNPVLLETLTSGYIIPYLEDQRGVSLSNDNNTLYFVLKKESDELTYLCSYNISGDSFTIGSEFNVALMLNRNTDSTANPPFNLEKGFHITEDKIYQIPLTYTGKLNMISSFDFTDTIIAITDHYVIDESGNLYEFADIITEGYFSYLFLDYWKEDYPTLDMEYRSDKFQVQKGMFIQVIGKFSRDGETVDNTVVLEGMCESPSGRKIQMCKVINQGSEMDEIEPVGEYTCDTDGLISNIITDFHDYITEGTLQDGADLGSSVLSGTKKSRKYFNGCKDFDGYTWASRPQGELDYDNATTSTGVTLKYEKDVDNDAIWDVDTIEISSGTNQVIVKGAINPTTGVPYEDQYDDEEDQQQYGVHKIIIVDALLDSNAKCLTKATAIGTRELGGYLTVQCSFRKTSVGILYPHQTITFKYISEDIEVSSATYIVDGIGMDLLRDICYLQASTGLIFEYDKFEIQLPEENAQKIEQNASEISAENYLEYDDDDSASYDILESDLTIDSAWHELDLDNYKTVPDNAIGFWARVNVRDTAGGDLALNFRSTSQSNSRQVASVITIDTGYIRTVLPIPLDSNHKFDYYAATGIDDIEISVLWWILDHSA